ncbi:MAG: TrmH family RNA methyltransferase, partial [Anaerolineae bacterium]
NPLVKRARALRQRKERVETGLFVVEGLHPVGEALEADWDIEAILYAPDVLSSSFGSALLTRYASKLQPVSSEVMASVADKENPQGILAIVRQRRVALSSLSGLRRLVGMLSPQDPGNVGTVLRTMDATDAEALILMDGGVDPYHPTSVRASMGALFWKPIVQASFDEVLSWSRAEAIHCIGTSAHAQQDYRSFSPTEPWLLLLGSEQKGLSAAHLAACETAISLPMRGRASSLNLAVAAGILLYQFSA